MLGADLICFSHLRWDFVFQRPNHLMSRCAKERRVLFLEEPMYDREHEDGLEVVELSRHLFRLVPHLVGGKCADEGLRAVGELLSGFCREREVGPAIHWLYTPMMLPVSESLPRSLVVYDCMDELSNFMHAPAELREREARLVKQADVMFTGGMALYEHKRKLHPNVHGVPSSVDTQFFWSARHSQSVPEDLARIPMPRVGYAGVIDERLDLDLLEVLARSCPRYQFVMVGPVAKIPESQLPRLPNIHYLGGKKYEELPRYMAGWDCAIMPFALNDATRFISPTKTPEYLAAGLPVVSTSIRDVVEPYERLALVRIGRTQGEFVAHVRALVEKQVRIDAAARDAFLTTISWDATWSRMRELMHEAGRLRHARVGSHAASQCVSVSAPQAVARGHHV